MVDPPPNEVRHAPAGALLQTAFFASVAGGSFLYANGTVRSHSHYIRRDSKEPFPLHPVIGGAR